MNSTLATSRAPRIAPQHLAGNRHAPKAQALTDARKFLVDAAKRIRRIYIAGIRPHKFDREAALAYIKARAAREAAELATREVSQDDIDYLRSRALRDGGKLLDEDEARFQLQLVYKQRAKALENLPRRTLERELDDERFASYMCACAETHSAYTELLDMSNFDEYSKNILRTLFKLAFCNESTEPTTLEAQALMQIEAVEAMKTYRQVFSEQLDMDFADSDFYSLTR